jgi:hypothetical protein
MASGTNQLLETYGRIPLSFEANQGQTDARVDYLSRGNGYALFLTPGEAVLNLQKPAAPEAAADSQAAAATTLRMQFVGANPAPRAVGQAELAGKSNYFLGNDPSRWRTDVSTYARVEYQDLYPGVNLVYYGNQQQLEYDFVVTPGADPGVIALAFAGAEEMTLDGQGNLVLHTAGGDVVERAPVVYQEADGVRQTVSARYVLEGNGRVGFAVGAYDTNRPLVLDPILSYSTYLGGSLEDEGDAIAVDGAGNVYVAGTALSPDFPTANPLQGTLQGLRDAFVAKLNPNGTALVFSTYLGGNDADQANDIAVDGAGSVYLTGTTSSTTFPTANPLQATNGDPLGTFDAFVTKLNANGSALLFSTYLGGNALDQGFGLALDGANNVYVTGDTASANFPTANPLQPTFGGGTRDGFVAKLNAAGTTLLFSTFLGGGDEDHGTRIAVDPAGHADVVGYTGSTNFPTATPLQSTNHGLLDVFVTQLNASGSALLFSTYLGGRGNDRAFGVAVDAAGNICVTGDTKSADFPTANPLQPTNQTGGETTAFVAKVNANGTALVFSTYLGGSLEEHGEAIAVDGTGNIYVTGETSSLDFPTASPVQPTLNGFDFDAFVAKLNASGSALLFSTYLGGSDEDDGFDIAVDGAGSIYVTGKTFSFDFPTANPLQPRNGGTPGTSDAFITKINPTPPVVAVPTVSPVTGPEGGTVNLSGMFADPDALNTHTVLITWGDGATDTLNLGAGISSYGPLPHTYRDNQPGNAPFTITVLVTDNTGASGTNATTVAVINVAPTATLSNSGPVNEGGMATVSFAGQTDPSPVDAATGFHYAYDFDNNGTFEIGDGTYAGSGASASATVPATFLADGPGTRVVRGRILDKDNGFTDFTTILTINNVAPTPTISGLPSGNTSPEGSPINLTATATDPGTADTAAGFTFAWSVTKNGNSFAAGAGAAFGFTPDDNGTYVVTLQATDKDNGTGTANGTLVVTNVGPTQVSVSATPATISAGETTTLSGTFTAPGAQDTHTVAIDWGDGSAPTALSLAVGVFSFSAAHAYPSSRPGNAPFTITATVTDKDGGRASASAGVTVLGVPPQVAIGGGLPAEGVIVEGMPLTLTAAAMGPVTGQGVTFAWTVTLGGVLLGSGSGPTFTFAADHSGSVVVTLQGTDSNGLTATASATLVATGSGPAVTGFVFALYRDVLGRLPDAPGYSNWVTALQTGALSRADVATGFLTSPEGRGVEVEHFYRQILHRASDAPGKSAWVSALLNGASEASVVIGFVTSVEYTRQFPDNFHFVDALYRDVLLRVNGTSLPELLFQTQALDSGLTNRAQLALGFLSSDEAYLKALDTFYMNYLRRLPDPGGRQALFNLLASGQVTPIAVQALFLASPEYFTLAGGTI